MDRLIENFLTLLNNIEMLNSDFKRALFAVNQLHAVCEATNVHKSAPFIDNVSGLGVSTVPVEIVKVFIRCSFYAKRDYISFLRRGVIVRAQSQNVLKIFHDFQQFILRFAWDRRLPRDERRTSVSDGDQLLATKLMEYMQIDGKIHSIINSLGPFFKLLETVETISTAINRAKGVCDLSGLE